MKGVLLRFCVGKIFCLILPEKFVEGPPLFEKIAGLETLLHKKECHAFPSKNLSLTGPKNFRGGTIFCLRKFPIWKNTLDKTGEC